MFEKIKNSGTSLENQGNDQLMLSEWGIKNIKTMWREDETVELKVVKAFKGLN